MWWCVLSQCEIGKHLGSKLPKSREKATFLYCKMFMPVARKLWGGVRVAKRWRRDPARGVRGHAPPRKIFENLMQNGAFWGNLEKKIESNSAYWFRTPSLIVLVGFQGGGGGVRTPRTPPPLNCHPWFHSQGLRRPLGRETNEKFKIKLYKSPPGIDPATLCFLAGHLVRLTISKAQSSWKNKSKKNYVKTKSNFMIQNEFIRKYGVLNALWQDLCCYICNSCCNYSEWTPKLTCLTILNRDLLHSKVISSGRSSRYRYWYSGTGLAKVLCGRIRI